MAASNIVLADAQATPVNHTFVPLGPTNDVFWFEDPSAASANGYWRVSLELKRPDQAQAGQSSAQRTFRMKIGMHQPVLETLGTNTVTGIPPAPTVSYIPRCFVEFAIPERATLLDRKNIRKMVYNLLNEAQTVALVETLLKPF